MTVEKILTENQKVMDFINKFRDNNEYNPVSIDEYNAKFKVELNHFLNSSGFSDETINLFKID